MHLEHTQSNSHKGMSECRFDNRIRGFYFILFEDYFTVEIIMIHTDQCPEDRATCEVCFHISSVITTTLINHPDP